MTGTYESARVKGWYITFKIKGTTQDPVKNRTRVSYSLSIYKGTDGLSFNADPKGAYYQVYTGASGSKHYKSYNYNGKGTRFLVEDGYFYVEHDADGTKSVKLTARWVSANETDYTPASLYLSRTITLPTIAREATLSVADDIYAGNEHELRINKSSPNLRVTILYSIAGSEPKTVISKTSKTLVHWKTSPSYLPTSREETVEFTTITYLNDVRVGSVKHTRTTLHVKSSVKPAVNSIVITGKNPNSPLLHERTDVYLAGVTALRLSVDAKAGDGADILSVSAKINSPGAQKSFEGVLDKTTYIILTDPVHPKTTGVTVTVIDSRKDKYTRAYSLHDLGITIGDYEAPVINDIRLFRYSGSGFTPDPQSDTIAVYVDVSAMPRVAIGPQEFLNTLTITYTDTKIGRTIPVQNKTNTPTTGSYPISQPETPTATIVVKDGVCNDIIRKYKIAYSELLGNIRKTSKGLAVALGKMSEADGFEVNLPTIFYKGAEIKNPVTDVKVTTTPGSASDSSIDIVDVVHSSKVAPSIGLVELNISVRFRVKTEIPAGKDFAIGKIESKYIPPKSCALRIYAASSNARRYQATASSTDGSIAIRASTAIPKLTTDTILMYISGSYFM